MKSWIREYWDRTPDLKDWFGRENYYDCFSPDVNSPNTYSYRTNFKIKDDEDILFARDTSRSCKEGLVITDWGLHFLDFDGHKLILWSDICSVKLRQISDDLYVLILCNRKGVDIKTTFSSYFFKYRAGRNVILLVK